MPEKEFKLPSSSLSELKKIIIAYAKSKSPSSLGDVNKLTGIHSTLISANNGFLESIAAIQGGNSKEATAIGKKLGLAFANNIQEEIEANLKELLESIPFVESMITALGIKPRTAEDFQSHIAYSLGKEYKTRVATGASTLVELLKLGNLIDEKEGLLYPKVGTGEERKSSPQQKQHEKAQEQKKESTTLISKEVTNGLPGNITLNINIQLTIPETENEKVYENFFQAMKKHLLA